jgi:hypothetical protein
MLTDTLRDFLFLLFCGVVIACGMLVTEVEEPLKTMFSFIYVVPVVTGWLWWMKNRLF